MMGRFKLQKAAKLWWQGHCRQNAIDVANVTWQYIKEQLQINYQSHIERLNEFLDCTQGRDTLDLYYQKIFKILKYAPDGMSEETKVAQFASKLNPPLDTRLHSK